MKTRLAILVVLAIVRYSIFYVTSVQAADLESIEALVKKFAPPVIGIETDPIFLELRALPERRVEKALAAELHIVPQTKTGSNEFLHVGGCVAALEILTGKKFRGANNADFHGERMGNAKYFLATKRDQTRIITQWKIWLAQSKM